uniref:Cystatin domain-containing protein n=1 Tax=Cavia porcellus TaxID=10141 RepID=H0W0T0_CAVPO
MSRKSKDTMAHPPGKALLAWALLLFLWGLQLLATGAWLFDLSQFGSNDDVKLYFPPTMEFAQHIFNQQHKDRYAFRVERILSVRREQMRDIVFFMVLKLRRTNCRKFQDDLDNCPFQKNADLSNVIICSFNVSTLPWITKFTLLNKTCS